MTSDAVKQLHMDLAGDLERIAKRFKTGAKFSLIVRVPHLADADLLIGDDDDYDAVIATIQKMRNR